MKSTQTIFTLTIVFLCQSVMAQGPAPKDVNVINTPDVNVANVPDVVVANTQINPIPVTDQSSGPQPSIYREQLVLTVPIGASNFSDTFNVGPSTPDQGRRELGNQPRLHRGNRLRQDGKSGQVVPCGRATDNSGFWGPVRRTDGRLSDGGAG